MPLPACRTLAASPCLCPSPHARLLETPHPAPPTTPAAAPAQVLKTKGRHAKTNFGVDK